jgi:hypothetical protein
VGTSHEVKAHHAQHIEKDDSGSPERRGASTIRTAVPRRGARPAGGSERAASAYRAGVGTERLAWYVAYGSNLDRTRLGCYLAGGRAAGAARSHPGCRDRRAPTAERAVTMPGTVYFAWESPTWTGGIAFYDPGPGCAGGAGSAEAQGQAYLLTAGQVADLLTQEMHREPAAVAQPGLDPDLDLDAVLAGETLVLGPGRYERVQPLPPIEGLPALTFTAPWGCGDVPLTAPAPGYLRVLGRGLAATRGWPPARSAAYLASRPGAAGAWSAAEVEEVLAA